VGSTDSFAVLLEKMLRVRIASRPHREVGGGSINLALRIETDRGPIFVKRGPPQFHSRFHAEAEGLKALAQPQALRVPKVLACACDENGALLALEWIVFGKNTRFSEATLGEQLAWQHRVTDGNFGWTCDNTIGATPQHNAKCSDWIEFFRERRLRSQLTLAQQSGASAELLDRGALLCELMDAFFSSYRPVPSLLHGDLWSGNWATDEDDMPVIFDPAVYFGDREADIAMTRLFGGFGPAFYTAYQSTWPLDPAAGTRASLYNLYHVLNHFNLFGAGYESQAASMIERLLSELGH
jgi:fructosamine-3-kinase